MLPVIGWRPAAAYFYVLQLDGSGLAWEYLRRNPEYRKQYCGLANPLDAAPAEFREKWGLTFRS